MNNKDLDLSQISDADLPPSKEDFRETFQWRIFRIMAEFVEGYQFISDFKKSITVFGSSSFNENNLNYEKARKFGRIASEEGYAVITGGGPGIMEAVNRGTYESGGDSVGINIQINGGERANKYLRHSIGFHYFFTRKVMLSFSSSGYVLFPGGFGTLDEFFEIVTLIQTKKITKKVAVVAVGKEFWEPLFRWIEDDLYKKHNTIRKEHLDIFHLVDTPEEAMEIIKNVKE